MSPGLSGLIARHLASQLACCDEIHVAVHGTAGPACARQHHRALDGFAPGWHDGEWIERRAGSGRELCWFPEPVGARDCYRAELSDPLLLHRAFPDAARISARVSATVGIAVFEPSISPHTTHEDDGPLRSRSARGPGRGAIRRRRDRRAGHGGRGPAAVFAAELSSAVFRRWVLSSDSQSHRGPARGRRRTRATPGVHGFARGLNRVAAGQSRATPVRFRRSRSPSRPGLHAVEPVDDAALIVVSRSIVPQLLAVTTSDRSTGAAISRARNSVSAWVRSATWRS